MSTRVKDMNSSSSQDTARPQGPAAETLVERQQGSPLGHTKHPPVEMCPRGQCPSSGCDCGYELPEEREAHRHTKHCVGGHCFHLCSQSHKEIEWRCCWCGSVKVDELRKLHGPHITVADLRHGNRHQRMKQVSK